MKMKNRGDGFGDDELVVADILLQRGVLRIRDPTLTNICPRLPLVEMFSVPPRHSPSSSPNWIESVMHQDFIQKGIDSDFFFFFVVLYIFEVIWLNF